MVLAWSGGSGDLVPGREWTQRRGREGGREKRSWSGRAGGPRPRASPAAGMFRSSSAGPGELSGSEHGHPDFQSASLLLTGWSAHDLWLRGSEHGAGDILGIR